MDGRRNAILLNSAAVATNIVVAQNAMTFAMHNEGIFPVENNDKCDNSILATNTFPLRVRL